MLLPKSIETIDGTFMNEYVKSKDNIVSEYVRSKDDII